MKKNFHNIKVIITLKKLQKSQVNLIKKIKNYYPNISILGVNYIRKKNIKTNYNNYIDHLFFIFDIFLGRVNILTYLKLRKIENVSCDRIFENYKELYNFLIEDGKDLTGSSAFLVGGGILKKEILDLFPEKIFSFHPANAHLYKNSDAIEKALESNNIAWSLLELNEGVDKGKVIHLKEFKVKYFSIKGVFYFLSLNHVSVFQVWFDKNK